MSIEGVRNAKRGRTSQSKDTSDSAAEDCPICLESFQVTHHRQLETPCCKQTICSDCADLIEEKMSGTCPYCRSGAPTSKASNIPPTSAGTDVNGLQAASLEPERPETLASSGFELFRQRFHTILLEPWGLIMNPNLGLGFIPP